MPCSLITRNKSTRVTGMVSGSLAISCTPTQRRVMFGITTGAATRGTTQSWGLLCGFGTAFCVQDVVMFSVSPKLSRGTRAKQTFTPLGQWLDWFASQCGQVGLWFEGSAHKPGSTLASLLLSDNR